MTTDKYDKTIKEHNPTRISKADKAIELQRYKVEFTSEDELAVLIGDNTHAKDSKAQMAVIRCITLVVGGSTLRMACRLSGVTFGRFDSWRQNKNGWYNRAVEIIQDQLDAQLDGKMTHLVNTSVNRALERLERGDDIVHQGEVTGTKAVSARDAAMIATAVFEKRNLLRNKPTAIAAKQSADDRLLELAQKFKEISGANVIDIAPSEITVIDKEDQCK